MTVAARVGRVLARDGGYTLMELVWVMVILTTVVSALTIVFVGASNAELDMNRRFQAQQQARTGVDKMRREIHCSSGISPGGTTYPDGTADTISVTIPGHCPTAVGLAVTTVTYRTALVSAERYRLERQVGTGPVAVLADHVRKPNVFKYTGPSTTTLGKLTVDLPINIQPPGSGSNWHLVADMVLRNTTRS